MGIIIKNSAGSTGHERMVIQTSDPSGGHLRLFPGTNQVVLTSITSGAGGSRTFESMDSGESYSLLDELYPRPIITSTGNIAVSFNNRYYNIGDPSTIDGSSYIATSSNGGQTWNYHAPSPTADRRYHSVSASRDGKYVLGSNGAYDGNGDVALSQDFGETWTFPVAADRFTKTFVDPTGENMIAGAFTSGDTRYSDDFGDTWSPFSETLSSLGGVLISGDGNYKVVYEQYESGGSGARVYISTDWTNWTQHNLTKRFSKGSISNDGKYILLPPSDGFITGGTNLNFSSDYGVTFNSVSLPGVTTEKKWAGSAMSSDGKYMIVAPGFTSDEYVYKSIDYGSTWSKISEIPFGAFNNVVMSKNGRYVYLAGRNGAGVWHSTNYMATWTQQFDASTSSGMFINF